MKNWLDEQMVSIWEHRYQHLCALAMISVLAVVSFILLSATVHNGHNATYTSKRLPLKQG